MASINLDDLMEKARELADAAGKKTGELYELSKYKVECIRLSNELKKLYEKLGATVYKAVKTSDSDNSEIDAITAEIDDRRIRIAEIKDIMAELSDKQICKNCGAVNPKDAVFCLKCGAKLEKREDWCGAADYTWDEEEEESCGDACECTGESGCECGCCETEETPAE